MLLLTPVCEHGGHVSGFESCNLVFDLHFESIQRDGDIIKLVPQIKTKNLSSNHEDLPLEKKVQINITCSQKF